MITENLRDKSGRVVSGDFLFFVVNVGLSPTETLAEPLAWYVLLPLEKSFSNVFPCAPEVPAIKPQVMGGGRSWAVRAGSAVGLLVGT